ncbi:LD-carboxypeptidase [Rhodoferax koreense]|uniref:LD-carboxypeptidase n=1 Tax=Rhodoferax koreensis TaxID=1842727 RepID=A0A1P8JWK6_9BURK|nr:LD-carboxypeptidase [Rhodoferax koreense]APW38150.1 LD-carboxypeptidase [Rhodoferax koreense]
MKKHIYIYSPSGAVRNKAAFKRGVKRLEGLGYEVEIDEAALKSHMRFAGDDATRVAAITRAAASGADVALISRGGYGLTRILDQLPYKALAKAVEKGTQFVGLSDFTAMQNAMLAKTGTLSWAGPALGEDFGVEGTPDDIMEACFDDLTSGNGEGTGWRIGAADVAEGTPLAAAAAKKKANGADFHLKSATLWGGNLAVLVSQVGTPYFPEIKGGVLFLEDVGEHPYRIERMLTQLLHAGVLARQKAIVLGQFTSYTKVPHDGTFRMATVVAWLQARLKVPVLTNLPFGHVPTKVLLPIGAEIELAVEGRDALMFWGHVGHTGHAHAAHGANGADGHHGHHRH